jgi:hypothetical protein
MPDCAANDLDSWPVPAATCPSHVANRVARAHVKAHALRVSVEGKRGKGKPPIEPTKKPGLRQVGGSAAGDGAGATTFHLSTKHLSYVGSFGEMPYRKLHRGQFTRDTVQAMIARGGTYKANFRKQFGDDPAPGTLHAAMHACTCLHAWPLSSQHAHCPVPAQPLEPQSRHPTTCPAVADMPVPAHTLLPCSPHPVHNAAAPGHSCSPPGHKKAALALWKAHCPLGAMVSSTASALHSTQPQTVLPSPACPVTCTATS